MYRNTSIKDIILWDQHSTKTPCFQVRITLTQCRFFMQSISAGDTPCTGGADEYLELLTGEIIPRAEAQIAGDISWRGIAGYYSDYLKL